MSQSVQLGDITLGCADGENEAKEDWFMDLFYDGNGKVEEIQNNRSKFIISGRKGTGKTILAKYIERQCQKEKILTAVFNKESFSMQYIIEKGTECVSDIELSHFLKYSILIQIAGLLIKEKKKIVKLQKSKQVSLFSMIIKTVECLISVRRLNRFYYGIYPNGVYKTVALEQEVYAEGEKSVIRYSSKLKHYRKSKYIKQKKNYAELESQLNYMVIKMLKFCDIYVFFDDLDELGEKIYTKAETNKIFIGLLEAAHSINNQFFDSGNTKSKCIVMLRTDIIDNLHSDSSNSGKMITDCQVKLNWLMQASGNSPLLEMVLTKIRKKCFKGHTNAEVFRQLFPVQISGKPFFRYLLDYSFGRPRDIVNYLNIIIQANRTNFTFHPAMFTDNSNQREYSSRFLIEIKNEMSIHYSAEMIDTTFNLLKNFGRRTFEFIELQDYFTRHRKEYQVVDDIKSVVQILYHYGVLGNSIQINRNRPHEKPKYNTFFGYREDGHLDADFDKRFVVHYALRKSLSTG